MPRLSIVIPLSGSVQHLEDSLVSVLENRPVDCEVVVVLNRRYDDPYDLHDEVVFVRTRRGASVVECINAGIAASGGEVVHVLRCGTEVTAGWADAAMVQFHDPGVGVVAPLLLASDDDRRVISAGWKLRDGGSIAPCLTGASIDQVHPHPAFIQGPDHRAVFMRKSALEAVGPCVRNLGERCAIMDRALALGEAGYRTILEPRCQVRCPDNEPVAPLGFRHGLCGERMFWRWGLGQQRWLPLIAHLGMIALEVVGGIPRPALLTHILGRSLALCQFSSYRRHRQEMAMWREHVRRTSAPVAGPHFQVTQPARMAG